MPSARQSYLFQREFLSLEHRRQMLDKVAKSLVAWQREFLDHGLAHLKPLVLRDVTNAIGMHESTVSRVITNKYMSTAHGIVALKSFFPSGTESYGSERLPSLTVKDTQKLVAAEAGLRPPPAWPPGGLRMSPDEEQLVRQAIEEQRARRPHSEPPPRSDSVETSGVPPEDEEPQRRRADEAAESLHQWVEQIYGIEFSRLAADPEVRAAYRDLQTALAHPQLRSAVLLALRAFAQAASAGATTPPPPDAVESVPRLQERPVVEGLSSIHDLNDLLHLAIKRAVALLEIESVSIILLDEARQELYFKVADDTRAGHEQRLREVRFPTTQGIAGWVIRESQSLIVPDVDQDPRFYRGIDVHTGTKTRSLICVPLRTQAWIIGVLEAINKRQGHFTAEDVRLLEAFANELALALENARLIQERYNLDVQQLIADAERLANSTVQFDTLIGESPKMQEVSRLVERVLNTTATVLLMGERGTGKDFIARVLHYQGPRAKGPFIAVNCAAIPETLLESELFGYERGAFTGATQRKPGRFELAAGGTLFLDEIDAMRPVLQAKLLRVLQDKQFERLGGTETLTTDARIVVATNQDRERLMTEGRFRSDLFHRLNVYPIALPPLRERQEDLGPLTMFFLKRFSQESRKEALGISKEAMGLLKRYSWPGNVRELENVIQRAVILCQGTVVTVQDLPSLREHLRAPVLSGDAFRLPSRGIALADVEKAFIWQALERSHQNKSHAAKLLGLSRTQLRTRMRHYGLE